MLLRSAAPSAAARRPVLASLLVATHTVSAADTNVIARHLGARGAVNAAEQHTRRSSCIDLDGYAVYLPLDAPDQIYRLLEAESLQLPRVWPRADGQ